MSEQAKQALSDLGGEPLAGSGFEDETPEPEFRDNNHDIEVTTPS
jgi:hypothetical protein